jgi:hypothetical protein
MIAQAVALTKEALLDAVGVGAYELHDYIEFSSWFRHTLLPVHCLSGACLLQIRSFAVNASRLHASTAS